MRRTTIIAAVTVGALAVSGNRCGDIQGVGVTARDRDVQRGRRQRRDDDVRRRR